MRQKKCKGCGERFTPSRPLQSACSPLCAIELVKAQKKKAERKEDKVKRERLKTRSDWAREAQAAVNAFVRERDKDLPCISCGRFHKGSYDAGHYRSVGSAPELRFDLANIHKQCVPCNQHKSGNAIEYRIGLVKRIGLAEVERLEGPQEPKKYSVEDLKAIRDLYREKLKATRREQDEKSN